MCKGPTNRLPRMDEPITWFGKGYTQTSHVKLWLWKNTSCDCGHSTKAGSAVSWKYVLSMSTEPGVSGLGKSPYAESGSSVNLSDMSAAPGG